MMFTAEPQLMAKKWFGFLLNKEREKQHHIEINICFTGQFPKKTELSLYSHVQILSHTAEKGAKLIIYKKKNHMDIRVWFQNIYI